MRKKCNRCGKYFNIDSSFSEYCPYCGQVLPEEDRQQVRKREYFIRSIPFIILKIFVIVFIILCLYTLLNVVIGN